MSSATPPVDYKPGLEGVVAGPTAISYIDPAQVKLVYRGYVIDELAECATFEEVAYLLLYGELPQKSQLAQFKKTLVSRRAVPPEVLEVVNRQPKQVPLMDVLRTAVSLLSAYKPRVTDNSHEANLDKTITLLAELPTVLASRCRAKEGKPSVQPNPELGHAANLLYMLRGAAPSALEAKVLEVSLICYAEHGFNASTFAARVCASTLADLHCCLCAAIGALKGPLHGGANEAAMEMLLEIGEPERAEPWVRAALAEKKKIMGFGHRIYRFGDSRTPIVKRWGLELAKATGVTKWHEISDIIERIMVTEKKIYPNVDFPAATAYYLLNLPIETYTPLFVISRVSGWAAHVIEQHDNNRLIRPSSFYTGPSLRPYVPLERR